MEMIIMAGFFGFLIYMGLRAADGYERSCDLEGQVKALTSQCLEAIQQAEARAVKAEGVAAFWHGKWKEQQVGSQ